MSAHRYDRSGGLHAIMTQLFSAILSTIVRWLKELVACRPWPASHSPSASSSQTPTSVQVLSEAGDAPNSDWLFPLCWSDAANDCLAHPS